MLEGMSVKIAIIDGEQWYIGGAPRSRDFGQVFLFQQEDDVKDLLTLDPGHVLTGKQFGAGFGYDIVVADFNLDKFVIS